MPPPARAKGLLQWRALQRPHMHPWFEPLSRRLALWNRRRLHQRHQRRRLPYAAWCARHDTLDEATRAALAQRMGALPSRPPVDLLLQAGAHDLASHQALWAAVQAQIYGEWRLHVGLGTAAEGEVASWWREQARLDARVRLCDGAADPAGLVQRADADWCAFIEADEAWRPHTLLLLIEAALNHAACELVYGDEDRICEDGQRSEPWFKGDFDAEALWAMDSIGSPALWRSTGLRARLGTSPLCRGADRHDLVLRGARPLAAQQVRHVPHVLCHRRPSAADAAAAARAVQAALQREGIEGRAEADPAAPGLVHVQFTPPSPPPHVTLVIPTRNGLHLLRRCIGSILARTSWPAYDIVIVDNGSDDPACLRWLDEITRDARVSVLRAPGPFNYSALNNSAIRGARGEFVALVNNDMELLTPDWLEEMVGLAARPGIGAVGARLWYEDQTLQHGGVLLGIGEVAAHVLKGLPRGQGGPAARALRLQAYQAVTGACIVVRKSTYLAVGGLDEEAFAVSCNDVDFCLKLAARGLVNLWTPHADWYHFESVSRGRDHDPVKKQRYLREAAVMKQRWSHWLAADPFYNPNLSITSDDFALAEPPRVSLRGPANAEDNRRP